MAVVLDTDLLPERDRVDALHAAYEDQLPRRRLVVGSSAVRHRVERLALGPHAHLLRSGGTAVQILRTARQVRGDAPEHVAIGLRRGGRGVVTVGGTDAPLPVGQLNAVDVTRPYRLTHTTDHTHDVLILGNAAAGLSVDVVRAAVPALRRSPVYDLVRAHLTGLFDAARALSPDLQRLTGQATTALVRALLTTAAADRHSAEALQQSLGARITAYLVDHLGDPDLTVERVAAAHHISVRHLYAVWAEEGHDRSPAQWLVRRRLEQAREQLAVPSSSDSIAAVARSCGFADASHFSRRFRQSFGLTPREWRISCSGSGSERTVAG